MKRALCKIKTENYIKKRMKLQDYQNKIRLPLLQDHLPKDLRNIVSDYLEEDLEEEVRSALLKTPFLRVKPESFSAWHVD